jgi:two-component system KDP operon response regulator KdpE
MTTDNRATILVVEDEREIRRFLRSSLGDSGFEVVESETLRGGLVEAGTRKPDLVILDLGLPDGDGVDFIRDIRAWSNLPIVVLSAREGERDKIGALDAGADDYLTKPFSTGELLARVRAALRRTASATVEAGSTIRFGTVEVDLARRQVTNNSEGVHLTPIEYRLLTTLLAHEGKVLTHRNLLREVWGPAYIEHNHYLRIYMGHLRHKLEVDPTRPRHLLTETGVGYRFVI